MIALVNTLLVSFLLAPRCRASPANIPPLPDRPSKTITSGPASPTRSAASKRRLSETKQWVAAEKAITADYFAKLPGRKKLRRRLEELWEYEKYGVPSMAGGRYFYTVDSGKADFPVLCMKTPQDPHAKVLLDPNTFSTDGTVALTRFRPSQDGKLLAYGVTRSGSDWRQWRVVETDTGKVLPDLISGIKWSEPSWSRTAAGSSTAPIPRRPCPARPRPRTRRSITIASAPSRRTTLWSSRPATPDG